MILLDLFIPGLNFLQRFARKWPNEHLALVIQSAFESHHCFGVIPSDPPKHLDGRAPHSDISVPGQLDQQRHRIGRRLAKLIQCFNGKYLSSSIGIRQAAMECFQGLGCWYPNAPQRFYCAHPHTLIFVFGTPAKDRNCVTTRSAYGPQSLKGNLADSHVLLFRTRCKCWNDVRYFGSPGIAVRDDADHICRPGLLGCGQITL